MGFQSATVVNASAAQNYTLHRYDSDHLPTRNYAR